MKITPEALAQFKATFLARKENPLLVDAVAKNGLNQTTYNNTVLRHHPFTFSHETTKGDITNQKRSGRCWMFASLNAARVEVMQKLDLKTFEFSQNYTLFWDKLEKSNYFLESIIKTVEEPLDSRLVQHLLAAPVQDGGQWDMFAGILTKYGAVPKSVMPETFHSSETLVLNQVLTRLLRQFACQIREQYQQHHNQAALHELVEDMMSQVYDLLTKALGEVPETFSYRYRDQHNQYHTLDNITPQQFFHDYVGWDLSNKISLINAPTKDKPFNRAFSVQYLQTVAEAKPVCYINVDINTLKQAAIESIKNNEPVWFGCDVGKQSDRVNGLLDENMYEYDRLLAQPLTMTKAQRLDYGESLLTHAMVLVGVDLDEQGNPITWKVENSWGKEPGKEGIFSMSDGWFDEYTYQIMVDKKYIPETSLKALDQEVIELKPWDPMGALAL